MVDGTGSWIHRVVHFILYVRILFIKHCTIVLSTCYGYYTSPYFAESLSLTQCRSVISDETVYIFTTQTT